MKVGRLICIAAALLALMLAGYVAAILKIEVSPAGGKSKGPERTRNFGEGLRLSRHGLYGIDLVSVGKAHMRKMRRGPFTIGAINELVLENVSLALPEELWSDRAWSTNALASVPVSEGDTPARQMLSRLGIRGQQLKLGGQVPRFSALDIRNLRVARIVDGTNAVPWFSATGAKARRGGLELRGGWSVENGVTNGWNQAFLAVGPKLELLLPPR